MNVYALNMDDFTLECNGQAVIDDIEQMQIYFGEDTDADGVANRMMVPDDTALDMNRVVSIRLSLLVRSANEREAAGAQEYFFDDGVCPDQGCQYPDRSAQQVFAGR